MSQIQLPSAKVLCNVLLQAENSKDKLKIKEAFLPILQAVLPNIYGDFQVAEYDCLLESFPNNKECVVLCSGGLGSTTSLWRVISSSRDPRIFFVEDLFERELELNRRECIKTIAIESKSSTGYQFIDEQSKKTWINSITIPPSAKNLSRKSRIIIIIASMWEFFNNNENCNLPCLIWGNIQDCKIVLQAMSPWGFTHFIPFPDMSTSLFAFCECENISDRLRELNDIRSDNLAPSQVFPRNVSNIVCSCWSNIKDTEYSFTNRIKDTYSPFLKMCGKCNGCNRYIETWKNLTIVIPTLRLGTRIIENREDHRHYENIKTLKIEEKIKRGFSEFIADKKDGKDKKKRGKKKKIEEQETKKDEEEEEEEEDEEEEEEEDEEINENSIILEEEDFANIPEMEENHDEDVEPNYEDFGESDGESSKKNKKKRII